MESSASLKEWKVVNRLCIRQTDTIKQFVHTFVKTHPKTRKRNILLSILVRCSSNLLSVALLSKFMVMNQKPVLLKLPVGLLLRSCYMDALLGLYICNQDDNHVEEIAEVLHADYVGALFNQFEVYRDNVGDDGFDADFLEHMYTMAIEDNYMAYLELNKELDEVEIGHERNLWKVTPRKKIRMLIPDKKVANELNIKTIWEYLKEREYYAECANILFAYYKYFSQYEHFSESSFGVSTISLDLDHVSLVRAVERLSEAFGMIQRQLAG